MLGALSMEGDSLHLETKGNAKGERGQKLSLMESMVKGRRGLADITNMMNQVQKPTRPTMMDQKVPNPAPLSSEKDCIAQLLKENTALLRLLGERNKIIELNDLELQRLRVSVQQLQQQNWQLARANSQMLEELNSGKDRLKAIQHQLGCTVAALNATKLELKMKNLKKELCNNEFIIKEQTSVKCEEAAVDPTHQDEKKTCIPSRKRTSRSQSLGSATVTHEAAKDNNRRKTSRRDSSNFKSQTCEPKEDLFEIEDVKFPVSSLLTDPTNGNHKVQQDLSVSSSSNSSSTLKVKKEEDMDAGGSQDYQTQDLHQSSIGRPSRRVTIGVSYKEPPLNTKMRRQ